VTRGTVRKERRRKRDETRIRKTKQKSKDDLRFYKK